MIYEVKTKVSNKITVEITLTNKELKLYDELDKLCRKYLNLNSDISDIVSDYGFSYSNDILMGFDLTKLEECLIQLKNYIQKL